MKKRLNKIVLFTVLTIVLTVPIFVSAQTPQASAGIKPSSFFYFLDTTFEKIDLFFTFDSEAKVKKALKHAEERVSEIEAVAQENNPEAARKAINNYEAGVALATSNSKDIKNEEKKEELLGLVSENTSKHRESLISALEKVPDEATEAILEAIEASKRGHEKALRQIASLKKEVAELQEKVQELEEELATKEAQQMQKESEKAENGTVDQQEVEELKAKIEKLKKEFESSKKPIEKPENAETAESETNESLPQIVSFPSGMIAEVDEKGNIVRVIKETITQSDVPQQKYKKTLEIISINVVPDTSSVGFEWETNKPTESKVFISGGNLSSKIFTSVSGLSTRHSVMVTGLKEKATYSYEIEAIADNTIVAKKTGDFETLPVPPTIVNVLIERSGHPVGFHVFRSGTSIPLSVKSVTLSQTGTIDDSDFEFVSYLTGGTTFEEVEISNKRIIIEYEPEHGNRILLNPKINSSGLGKTFSIVVESIEVELGENEVQGSVLGLNKSPGYIAYPEEFIVIPEGEGNSKLTQYCESRFATFNPTYSWFNDNACMISN